MDIKITIAQVARFLWMAILIQLGVYVVTGMICWYGYTLTLHRFSIGLSWAGLLALVVAGVFFMTAKPKSRRPSMFSILTGGRRKDSEKRPLDDIPTLSGNLFSAINPLSGRRVSSGKAEDPEQSAPEDKEPTEEEREAEKASRRKLYYNSGLAAAVGVLTIASSEIIYRVVMESAK